MNISTAFIKRPVATSLLCLGLVLAGAVALWLLPVAPLPQADVPTIKVSASLPGASPETMASTVALPLERALGRIAGVTEMSSTSTTGATSIRLTFDLARPPQGAARDVQAALNTARAELPSDLPASPSYRAVSSADAPIMVLALTSHELAPAQIHAAADNFVRILTQVDGVGEVELVGSSPPAVQVALDPDALNRHGLGIPAVRRAVGAATPNLPLGTIAAAGRQWQVVTSSPLSTAAALAEVPVAWRDGAALRLADVARVAPGQRDPYHTGLANGAPAVLAIVHRKPDANILKTLQRIDARLPALRAALPGNVAASVVVDRATTIRASMRAAGHTLAIAMLLVALVMLAFLRDLRAALIASAAAPIALAGALAVMYALGYSLDNLSLMALTIAIGFAVDDAVVVVENIARHVEAGEPPASAARTGAGEIGLTVLAMSLVLVAVFIPLLFMGGYAGLFVREFAGTIAIVIAVSLLVSLTVVPMLCAKWLRPVATGTAPRGPRARIRAALDALLAAYMRSLAWVLRHQLATLVVLGAVVALNVLLFVVTPKGFFPRQDTGELTGSMTVDHGGSFQVTRAQLARFAAIVRADPAVQSVAAYAHRANGTLFATLLPLGQRDASADAVAARLRRRLAAVPGASFAVQSLQDIRVGGRRSRSSDQYTIEADTAATLQQWAPRIARALAVLPELREVTVESAGTGVQTVLDVDATAAARHGVSLRTIAGTLHDGFAEPAVAVLYAGAGRTYPVVLNLAPAHIQSPAALTDLAVAGAGDAGVPLADVATVSQRGAPLAVDHLGQFNAVTISFVPAPGVALSTATRAIERAVAALALPNAVRGSFQGSAQAFRQAAGSEPALLGAALLTLFIVLGVLYESLAHPLTILSTLPSAGVGALLALLALRMDFSVIALIGVFALIGIVMKNAIMMVDFALHAQRTTGASPEAAIAEACRLRFRPILMTSLAVFLAAIPLAILHGDGAEMRQPLGVAIGGGLVVSQLLTLYTTPVVYLYLDRGGHWMRRRFGMLAARGRGPAGAGVQSVNDVHAIRGGRRLLLLLCSLALGACAMGPDYVRPPVATPAHYGEPHAAPAATAATAAPWWSRYDDPVLAALVARVTVDNQSLKAAAARVAEARALARAARGQLKPSAAIGTFNVGTGNRRDFGVGIGWEIDLWGKLRRNVEAHGASATASADDLAAATLSLQATLVKAYFALREKDAAIALLQPAVATDARALTVVRNQQQQGVASLADVTRAHTRLAASRTQLSADALARAQLQHAIAVLLGVPPAEFELAPAPFTASVPAIPAGLPSELLERRPDIAAAERRMAAASAMIGVRKAEAMPSLNLVAGVGALHGLFATPSVKAPLYEGGALRANVAHARAEYDEAVANYRQTVLDAFREVEDNLAAQRILAQAVAPRAAAADAAGQLARAVNNQFQAGVASAAALADAETDALDNARGNLDLRLQRLDASADLVVALGGGWQNPDARAPAATATAAPAARDEPRP